MMDKIRGIYESLQKTDEMRRQQELVDRKVDHIMLKGKEEMDVKEYEDCREKYYQVAMLAEEGGFVLGFQYAVRLMQECFEK